VAAVAEGLLCFLAAEVVVGGRSISVFERINPSCSEEERSLSLSRWW